MSLPAGLAEQTVIRLRATDGAEDSHGNPTQTWVAAAITGCAVQPIERAIEGGEFVDRRQMVVVRWAWWGPVDADVLSTDRIVFDNITFEVDGPINHWLTVIPHKSAVLKLVEQ